MEEKINIQLIRDKLEAEHKELSRQIEEENARLGTREASNPDRADLAQDYSSQERRTAFLSQMEEQLEELESALNRLDEGTYGKCVNCGEQIAPARLEALPHALYCVECKSKLEG
jgi:DnaK suppressor protein